MGLVYDAAESDRIKTALSGNLTTVLSILEKTESASSRLIAALDSGELSGRSYSAAQLVLTRVITPQIAAAREEIQVITGDVTKYTYEDGKVSRFGVLKEDELNAQLTATRAQRDLTEHLKEANQAVVDAVSSVLPGARDALSAVDSQLELVLMQLEHDLRDLNDRLEALHGFELGTRGLFHKTVSKGKGVAMFTPSKTKPDPMKDAQFLTDLLNRMTPEQRSAYLNSAEFREWASKHWEGAKLAMDAAADSGLIATKSKEYANFLTGYWNHKALVKAGIDPEKWDLSRGTEANWETIKKVYDYYGRLYLGHPDLQWAGMANMIGPSFAGGFRDLGMLRSILKSGIRPPYIPGDLWAFLSRLSDEELRFYETTLLGMQKEIFLDQARQHEAFLAGGIKAIERLHASGAIDDQTTFAWGQIASGDPAQIAEGNAFLLKREQKEIINDDYDAMRNHPVTGEAMTQMITMIGAASIPGAKTFPEVFSQGNISIKDDRWALIREDTLPIYQDLVKNHPDQVREIIGSDFTERTEKMRILPRLPEIIDRLRQGYTGKETMRRRRLASTTVIAAVLVFFLSGCGFVQALGKTSTTPECDTSTQKAVPMNNLKNSQLDESGQMEIYRTCQVTFDLRTNKLLKEDIGIPATNDYVPDIKTDGPLILTLHGSKGTLEAHTDRITFFAPSERDDVSEIAYFLTADTPEEFFTIIRDGAEAYGFDKHSVEYQIETMKRDPEDGFKLALKSGYKLGFQVQYDLRYKGPGHVNTVIVSIDPTSSEPRPVPGL